uniref:Uncharacterized protein n=1 Tax=Onchocerca volvulus TaxID=6282 RepID=A0A8R1XXS2_ONCVO
MVMMKKNGPITNDLIPRNCGESSEILLTLQSLNSNCRGNHTGTFVGKKVIALSKYTSIFYVGNKKGMIT